MGLPLGHRTRRVQKPRGTIERTDARGSHGNPPFPQTHARAEDQRENNIDRWDERHLLKELTRLQGLFSRAEEVTDGIVQWLNARGLKLLRRKSGESNQRTWRWRLNDPIWELRARLGIGHLHLDFGQRIKGNVPVAIDGAKAFLLTAAAADLLAVLAADERAAADGFPPFRSVEELAEAYSAKRNRPETVRAVVVGLIRLRQQLMLGGAVSPGIVEGRDGGARLRIRRSAK